MIVQIEKGTATGRITAPPSKSMAHRYLICAALSGGSTVKRVEKSDDINATLGCLSALGAEIEAAGKTFRLGGLSPEHCPPAADLLCGESGSTLRFMLPLCLLTGNPITLHGSKRLMQRSLTVYEELCAAQGIAFAQLPDRVAVRGRLTPGKYAVRGDISSQFISGLLFALPLLPGDSVIGITGGLQSAPYLQMTIKALADFGVWVRRQDENTILVPGGQTYKKRAVTVEGDYSNAAFFEALNTLGGNVMVEGLQSDTLQGDAVYLRLLPLLARGTPTIDLADCPDLGPVLMAVAAAQHGAVFTGTKRLKIKESDRGAAMAEELLKFGIKTRLENDCITVEGGNLHPPVSPLSGHRDHRIVMALAVLCTCTGGTICGAQAVAKSFPDFFRKLGKLGIKIKAVKENET